MFEDYAALNYDWKAEMIGSYYNIDEFFKCHNNKPFIFFSSKLVSLRYYQQK